MDWNSDGLRDIVSGDRDGYFNVFIETGSGLEAHYKMLFLNGDTIDVGYNSQPAVTDWDLDGKKDLLLGTETGYIQLYLNQATDTWPMFQTYSNIQAGGSDIYLNRVNPYVVDLDLDGKRDLVCGANDGYVRFYRNIGSDTNPTLAAEELLYTTGGTPIQPSGTYVAGSRCGFGDWNNDGALDFLISGYEGYVELYLGEGVGFDGKTTPIIPTNFTVMPNPARSIVNISYSLNRAANIELSIFDATGRQISLLESGKVGTGEHSHHWQTDLPAGVYLAKLTINDQVFTRRIVLTN